MSLRTVAGLAAAAAAVFAPTAHAAEIARVCAMPYGSAVPASLRHWQCVGTGTQKPGCVNVGVNNPNTSYPLAGIEICGLV
ncbi:MAG: hypothetical protein QOE05_1279 [Actinomycetota bacterium]|nr:hypothetical protein [Actinomycetota bacterium]